MVKERYLVDSGFKGIEPFEKKIFRYLYNRDSQQNSSIYAELAA